MAYRSELIPKNPLISPKLKRETKNEAMPYNLEQIENLLKNAEGELKSFLYFAFYTGARSGKILALRWQDIGKKYITINKTLNAVLHTTDTPKNGKERKVFILEPLKKFLANFKNGKKDEALFNKTYFEILRNFKILCKKLGYPVQGLHSTRHTFISLCVGNGVDLPLIQKMVGHSDLTMIMKIYTHYIDDKEKLMGLNRAFGTKLAQEKIFKNLSNSAKIG